MKRLISLSLCTLIFSLSGCGEETDQLPVDGRDFDGDKYNQQTHYTGKVIDGYLQNARVWLDMDGDSQYTPGPLTITLENGTEVILPSGEPTAMSGEGGVFSLDISELNLESSIGPDLKAVDYPLYALAIPNKTLEETRNGNVAVKNAYMMSASPGVKNITPLTTLARYRTLTILFPGTGINPTASFNGLNLIKDYILTNDHRSHAYAQALARLMGSQFPEEYSNILKKPESNGTERYLSKSASYLLGISVVHNAEHVFAIVDAAEQAGYDKINIDELDLPLVPLELDDPVLLTSQRIYAEPSRSDTLPANQSDLTISSELTFDYSEDGRLQSISSDGCMAPSMSELARLIRVNGYMANLDTQWLPAAALSAQSAINHSDEGYEGIDERLVFKWNNKRIEFETKTTCHDHEGIQAGSTELGGTPEVVYSWAGENDELEELVASIPASGATRKLSLETTNATKMFPGYRYSENNAQLESLLFSDKVTSCEIDEKAVVANLAVSAQQNYSFSGYDPQPASFSNLVLEFDNREFDDPANPESTFVVNRLLRYGFLDPALSTLGRVEADNGFEWIMLYPEVGSGEFVVDQPNLIGDAYLNRYSGADDCGREFKKTSTTAYARVEYRYQNLSEYLTGLLQ